MKIAIESAHANKNQKSGVENVCYFLIQNLKKIIPPEHQILLYTNKSLKNGLEIMPTHWQEKVLAWPLKKIWSQIRLSYEFLVYSPDIFFAPGQLIPWFCPKNTIVFVHDSAFMSQPKAYGFLSRVYLKWMNKRIVKVAKKIIVSAEFNKQELLKYYKINLEKITVVPLAYDKNLFHQNYSIEDKQKVLKKYRITDKYLLSVGRLEDKKNTVRIVEAFELFKKEGREEKLVLVGKYGKGKTGQTVREKIANSEYKKDILVIDWVDDIDLPLLFSGAEVFVFPSNYEGFGLPILEAMAVGCPVIISNTTAMLEVGGDAVESVDPKNTQEIVEKIKILVDNATYRQEKIEKGLKRVKDYSWEKTAEGVWKQMCG
jgi:glycosyltransferase involved in cell wall biosynthesis